MERILQLLAGMTLDNGQTLPTLEAAAVGGGRRRLPADLGSAWTALLFYRGHW